MKRRNGMSIECFNDVKEILKLKRRMISGRGVGQPGGDSLGLS